MILTRSSLFRFADALVILCVCKNAAWSIVHDHYGHSSGEAQVLVWYGFAALYAGASWASGAGPRPRHFVRPVARLAYISGTVACFAFAWMQRTTPGELLLDWYDWVVLACSFGYNAIRWRPV